MSHDNRALSEAHIKAWNAGDLDAVLAFFTTDCVYDDDGLGASFHGQEELRGFVTAVMTAIPDFSWTITSLVADGDRVFCEGMISGTQSGDLPGIPATGKRFEIPYVCTDELSDGLIRRHADYWNLMTYLQQVGIMPTPV